jgi:hypothetical protein
MRRKIEEIPLEPGTIYGLEIRTMAELTEEEYIDYVKNDKLLLVDHHGVLRSGQTGQPFACTPEQVDLLIDYLQNQRQRVGE